MASTPSTFGNLQEVQKEVYEQGVVNTVVQDSEMLDLYNQDMNVQTDPTTGGKYVKTAHLIERGGGYGARGLSGAYIPENQPPAFKNAQIPLKRLYASMMIEGPVFDRIKNDEGAFVNEVDRQVEELEEGLTDDVDRQLYGLGGSIIARVNQAVPAAALVVDSSFGVAGLTRTAILFHENDMIVFSAAADGDPLRSAGSAQSAIVDNIDIDTDTLTLDALPAGVADDDFIFRGDEADTSAPGAGDDREVMGILGHVDDGTLVASYFGLDRATYRQFRSFVFDISGAPYNGALNEDALLKADDETQIRGGGAVTHILASRDGVRSYFESLKSDRRFPLGPNDPRAFGGGTGKELPITLGTRTVMIRGLRKMPPEVAFGVDASGLKRFENQGFSFDSRTGSMWKTVQDSGGERDAVRSFGVWEFECINKTPNKCFKLTGISPAA